MRYIAIIDEDDMPALGRHFRIEEVPDPASTLEILEVMLKDQPMTPERWGAFYPLLAGYLAGLVTELHTKAESEADRVFWATEWGRLSVAWAAYKERDG